MATEIIDDDDAWLYGDSKKDEVDEEEPGAPGTGVTALSADAPEFEPKERTVELDKEAGELSGDEHHVENIGAEVPMEEEAAEEEEEEEEDSDDDVQITIGDIKSGPVDAPRLFKGAAYQRNQPVVVAPAKKPADEKGVDVDTPGAINGVSIYEFDLETIQEKPWVKPGADLTDYFNYGFNEDTWKKYCEKQKMLRMDYNPGSLQKALVLNTHSATGQPHSHTPYESRVSSVSAEENKNANSNLVSIVKTPGDQSHNMRRAAPPPRRKFAGTIDVIGSTDRDSRRPAFSNSISVTGSTGNDYNSQQYASPVSSIPSHSAPPSQPDFSAPPPMMHQAHASIPDYSRPPPSNLPPPQYGPGPGGYYGPPPGGPPPPGPPPPGPPPPGPPPGNYDYYGGQPQPSYGPPPQQYGGAPPPAQQWDNRSPDRGGSPPRHWDYSGHPGTRSEGGEDFGSRDRYRERSRSRERDRGERRQFKEHKEHKKR